VKYKLITPDMEDIYVNTPIKEGKSKGKVHSMTGHEGPDVE
jgi:hypothetical protein